MGQRKVFEDASVVVKNKCDNVVIGGGVKKTEELGAGGAG